MAAIKTTLFFRLKSHYDLWRVFVEIYFTHSLYLISGIEQFQEALISKLKESEEKPLPDSWHKFLNAIQSYSEKILPWDNAIGIFTDIMSEMNQSMISLGGSPELSLGMVLKYLHSTGEIVWFPDNNKLKNIIFHRPETLIEMLRAVFRHDFEEVVMFVEEHGSLAGLTSARFDILKQDFIKRGLMAYELLNYTLIHFELSTDALCTFVSLMLKFDLCYEVEKSSSNPSLVGSSCVLLFPWFFPEDVPEGLETKWPTRTPPNTFELRYCLSYFSFQPVLHDWCNKGRGMCYPVCGMVHIKEPLLLFDKSSLCGSSGFPFSLSEWSLTICLDAI